MIYIANTDDYNNPGVKKKIDAQIKNFNAAGLNCSLYTMEYNSYGQGFWGKLTNRLPFINTHKNWILEEPLLSADLIYMRKLGPLDYYLNHFFIQLKKINPSCKICMEIPTYPYDMEYKKWHSLPLFYKDLLGRDLLSSYIDRIAVYTEDEKIFGCKAINFNNGIDMDDYTPKKPTSITDELHCISVSSFQWWHGYDRFIEGLHHYYSTGGTRNIIFHMVGDGREASRYLSLTDKYNLNNHVIFHGMQVGSDLDEIYDKCTIGIASLGFYRLNLNEGKPLKTREYLAKGLPFIFSAKVMDISNIDRDKIYLEVPNNDTPIIIQDVINFHDLIYKNESEESVINRLRKFAEDNYSVSNSMDNVIKFFQESKTSEE